MKRVLYLVLALSILFVMGLFWKGIFHLYFNGKSTEATIATITSHASRCDRWYTLLAKNTSTDGRLDCIIFDLGIQYSAEDGKIYSKVIEGDNAISNIETPKSKYKVNDKVSIRYNPKNPDDEIVESWALFPWFALLILICSEVLLIYLVINPNCLSKFKTFIELFQLYVPQE